MNSYISNSSFFKHLLLIPLLIGFAYFSVGYLLEQMAMNKTVKSYYVQSSASKLKHMDLNHEDSSLDYIFIGSSRTEYHLSNDVFNKKGYSVYNLGVAGNTLANYSSVVEKALEKKPKAIVISLSLPDLYQDYWVFPITLNSKNLQELASAGVSKTQLFEASLRFLEGTNKVRVYADSISSAVEGVYSRFNTNNNQSIKQSFDIKDYPFNESECEIAKIAGTSLKTEIKCVKGDAILIGNDLDESNLAQSKVLNSLDFSKINFINQIADKIKSQNCRLILVLEPVYFTQYHYDIDDIKNRLKMGVIDNTAMYRLEKPMWFDFKHLNYLGRRRYSSHLVNQLTK